MKIVIINYESGNVASVVNAFEKVKASHQIIISNKIADIKAADFLVLPGVGSYGDCMAGLAKIDGLIEAIKQQVLEKKKPFLGICVGMQVLSDVGFENGKYQGFGFIEGEVKAIPQQLDLVIPHMGWNNINVKQDLSLIAGIKAGQHFYFANSYYFAAKNADNIIAEVDYGIKIPAIIAQGNIFGVQFHPEKSGEVGLSLLQNFLQQC